MVIFKHSLNITKSKVETYKSFEIIEILCKTTKSVYRLMVVYRPPPSKKNKLSVDMFLSEFQQLVIDKTLSSGTFLIVGDFIFYVDSAKDTKALKFLSLLNSFNLHQNVNESTREKGQTLDLVISSTVDPSSCEINIKVDFCGQSDHHCVHFEISTPKPGVIRKTIRFRKTKSININDFKVDIRASNITQKVASASSIVSV